MGERKYRSYTEQFTLEALALLEQHDKSAGQIERELVDTMRNAGSIFFVLYLAIYRCQIWWTSAFNRMSTCEISSGRFI